MTESRIPFMNLTPGSDRPMIDEAIARVVQSGWFILGPEVQAFEREFARAVGARRAVGVGTGTDALALILRALGVGPGDEVITSPLSAAYTALAIMMLGATPVFADIDPERLTIDPQAVQAAITSRTVAIMPVHLYGQPADMRALAAIATGHGLAIIEDCCQSHLATVEGRPVGSFSTAAAYSFYPTKNLGALGDGGAVTTDDDALADRIARLRNGGQSDRYHHAEFGINSRLDEMQAAILRTRLTSLSAWTTRRRELARVYRAGLAGAPVHVPVECDPGHVYHLFPILSDARERLRDHLTAHGIETLIHYPVPIPRQPALAAFASAACPVADRVCDQVMSVPLHPALPEADVRRVCDAVLAFVQRS